MSSADLRALWKLHLIDEALYEIRARAAALDPGRKIQAEINELQAQFDEANSEAHKLAGELADHELEQKSSTAKIDKINKDLYGGKIVNPREVEAFQAEIESLRKRIASHDDRIFELLDLVGPAKDRAETFEKQIKTKKVELVEHQKKVMAAKTQLESAFKEKTAARKPAAEAAPKLMLEKYEPLLKKHGTAMAQITKQSTCGTCGMALATRTIEFVKEGKLMTCEGCHRILYFTEGVI